MQILCTWWLGLKIKKFSYSTVLISIWIAYWIACDPILLFKKSLNSLGTDNLLEKPVWMQMTNPSQCFSLDVCGEKNDLLTPVCPGLSCF